MTKEIMSAINFITAPCGCVMDCPSKLHLMLGASEAHIAAHREHDAGIIHNIECREPRLKKIPVPKLIINEEVLKKYNA